MLEIQTVVADLNNKQHADAYLSLMSHYACDPMGGGEDINDFAKQNLVSTLLKRTDIFIVLILLGSASSIVKTIPESCLIISPR